MIRIVFLTLISVVMSATGAWANQITTKVEARLPFATGWECKNARVDVDPYGFPIPPFTYGQTEFDFGKLEPMYDQQGKSLGVYNRSFYFVCDIQLNDGTGWPTLNITYEEGISPANQDPNKSLGTKALLTVSRVDIGDLWNDPADDTDERLHRVRLAQINTQAGGTQLIVHGSEFYDGYVYKFPRLAVSLSMGDPAQNSTYTAGIPAVPFTNDDKPGHYNGTLIITVSQIE